MAPSKKPPVLSLSTLAPDRPVIEIDNEKYEIATEGDLGLVNSGRLDELRPTMVAFSNIKGNKRTPKVLADMSDAFKTFVELIVRDCDKSVTDKLNDSQRMAIIGVFTDVTTVNVTEPKPKSRTSRNGKRTTTAKT